NGTGVSGSGAIVNGSATPTALAAASAITLLGNSSVGGANTLTINGPITGAFTLSKVGAGTVLLTNTGITSNLSAAAGVLGGTFTTTGTVALAGGTLAPGGVATAVGTITTNGNVAFNGGTLSFDLGLAGAANIGGTA